MYFSFICYSLRNIILVYLTKYVNVQDEPLLKYAQIVYHKKPAYAFQIARMKSYTYWILHENNT